ncbi:HEAT repeat-containing protein, partial [Toxoplasma gondii VAND]
MASAAHLPLPSSPCAPSSSLLPSVCTRELDEKWHGACSFLLFSRAPYNPTPTAERASLPVSSARPSAAAASPQPPPRPSESPRSPVSPVASRERRCKEDNTFGAVPPPSSDRVLLAARKAEILWKAREEELTEEQSGSHSDPAKEVFNRFFSEDAEERLVAAASISSLCAALGDGRKDFIAFLLSFVETENDSLVLEVVARELHWLLSHACPKPSEAVVAARVDPESCELSVLVSLLQTLLWTADETVKETALAAFYRLFSLASLSEADEPAAAGKKSATVFINVFLPRLWRLLADGSAKAQQVAAQLLPSALFHLQGTLDDLSRNPAEGSDAPRAEIREKLERSREQLVDAFVKYVCGGPDLSSLTLQLEAGKHLPLFVAFVAKVLHSAPSRFASGDANAKDKLDPTDANAPEAATRILHALREALQAVLRAASEALKMQGIRALAAMAQTDPVVFRTLGDNLLPMLFADPSWRIRAAVCEALDRLGLFLVSSVPSKSSDHGQDKDSSEEEQDSLLPEAALGPGTCIVSVLIQFLKDRDVRVEETSDPKRHQQQEGRRREKKRQRRRGREEKRHRAGRHEGEKRRDRKPQQGTESLQKRSLRRRCFFYAHESDDLSSRRCPSLLRFLVSRRSFVLLSVSSPQRPRFSCTPFRRFVFFRLQLNVKAAALRTTRKLVKMTGNCSGVLQSFLEEGESIFSAVGISQNAPILVECMATVCTMAEAAKTEEGKWQLTVFAFSLLRVDDWHVALCFLKNLHIFVASPPPSFLS